MKKINRIPVIFLFLILTTSSIHAQQAQVNLDWNPHKNLENLVPFGANIISPEVSDDRMVTLRVKAPKAQEVSLASGPLTLALGKVGQAVPFQKNDDGVWTLKAGPVKPNIYVYKLNIDGAIVPDPNNTIAGVGDQPPYSMLIVHGDGPAYYDARKVPHGAITRHIYHSDVLNGEREMFVYTPPGYSAKKKYPVLYLLGGSGEMASNWAIEGRANFILDNLLAEGKAIPMIIAMPNNQVVHRSHPKHAELTFNLFGEELRKHIVPFIEQNYSVRANRKGRALAGLSMGGRHAQLTGFKALDLFASFGVLSAGDPETEKSSAEFLNNPNTNKQVDYLFVGQGTFEDRPTSRTNVFHDILTKHNIKHEYYVGGDGAHDWGTWRHLLYAKFLPGLWRK